MVKTVTGNNGNNTLTATRSGVWPFKYWESWKMYGLGGHDVLTGGPKNDTLDGGSGIDRMVGGAGNDVYYVDNISDTVIEKAGQGADSVRSTVTYSLPGNVESLSLSGSAAINGYGNSLDNSLIGNSNNNVLRGRAGNDGLFAGAGNDTLDGGTGADRMYGGTGNDTYVVDNANDFIYEGLNQGADTVQSSLFNYTLGDHLEHLKLVPGSGAYHGKGNNLHNRITGNNNNNTLRGEGGVDVLDGGYGNDTLLGGTSSDILVGGSGNDRLRGYGPINDDVRLLEYDRLTGGGNADTFVLGDAHTHEYGNFSGVFYLGADRAHITDFSRAEGDKIEVVGNLNDYTLDDSVNVIGASGRDTSIYYKNDLIAIAENVTGLSKGIDFVVGEPDVVIN